MRNKIGKSYITYSQEGEELIIEDLFVNPSARGKKLGYKLLNIALKHAQDKELTLVLYAEPLGRGLDTEELIKYFEDFGFVSVSDCGQLMIF